ncbi:MAG: hypothetical protein QG670_422 [Thermoproteota archaeon]|nr:hypothetical protein [Thermoproteota archaeon]
MCSEPVTDLIYYLRELADLVIFVALLGLVFLVILQKSKADSPIFKERAVKAGKSKFNELREYTVWEVLNIALFLPMVAIGSAISFPPLVFGSALAWRVSRSWIYGSSNQITKINETI